MQFKLAGTQMTGSDLLEYSLSNAAVSLLREGGCE